MQLPKFLKKPAGANIAGAKKCRLCPRGTNNGGGVCTRCLRSRGEQKTMGR